MDDERSNVGYDVCGGVFVAAVEEVAEKAIGQCQQRDQGYEKLVVPPFPLSGEMTNLVIAIGLRCLCAGGCLTTLRFLG